MPDRAFPSGFPNRAHHDLRCGGRPWRSSSLKSENPSRARELKIECRRPAPSESALHRIRQRIIGRTLVRQIQCGRRPAGSCARRAAMPAPAAAWNELSVCHSRFAELEYALPDSLPHTSFSGSRLETSANILWHASLASLREHRDRGLQRSEVPGEIQMLVGR